LRGQATTPSDAGAPLAVTAFDGEVYAVIVATNRDDLARYANANLGINNTDTRRKLKKQDCFIQNLPLILNHPVRLVVIEVQRQRPNQ
jgi:hypothetical protein